MSGARREGLAIFGDVPPTGARMHALLRELFPIRGLIVSEDLDRAFARVVQELPGTKLHEYETGATVEDWVVPPAWEPVEAVLTAEGGEVIASLEDSILFVAPHSEPVDGWFTKTQIESHLRTRPDFPDAFLFEHRNAYDYRKVDWGITLPFRIWDAMRPDARYHVRITVKRSPGTMKVAELFLPGRRPEVICICAHIDEPLCNDDLSGCVVAIELAKILAFQAPLEFSYQILLLPEMFGSLFYLAHNRERVDNTVGMLNLETVGAGEGWVLKRALRGGELMEGALHAALTAVGAAFREIDFFDGFGNDERVFGWPTFNIPGVSLQRYPFREYHTSFDTPDIIRPSFLEEALQIGLAFVEVLERNYVPVFRGRLQPWLTRHGLYFDATEDPEKFQRLNNRVLFSIDGRTSVLELARRAELDFGVVWDYLERFADAGLIDKRPAPARG